LQQNQNIIINKHELKINKYEKTITENDKKINSFMDKLKNNEKEKMNMLKDFQENIQK
jgi:glucan phosphoethanolaminetransferase (alkaline phosphatase superfamily)